MKAARSGLKFTMAAMVLPKAVTPETKGLPGPKGPRELDENRAALEAMVEHAVDGIPSRLRGLDAEPEAIRWAYCQAYLAVWASMFQGRVGPPPFDPPKRWESLDGHAKRIYLRGAVRRGARRLLVRWQTEGITRREDEEREVFLFVEGRRPAGRLPALANPFWDETLADWHCAHPGQRYQGPRPFLDAYRRGRLADAAEEATTQQDAPRADLVTSVGEDKPPADLDAITKVAAWTDRQRGLLRRHLQGRAITGGQFNELVKKLRKVATKI